MELPQHKPTKQTVVALPDDSDDEIKPPVALSPSPVRPPSGRTHRSPSPSKSDYDTLLVSHRMFVMNMTARRNAMILFREFLERDDFKGASGVLQLTGTDGPALGDMVGCLATADVSRAISYDIALLILERTLTYKAVMTSSSPWLISVLQYLSVTIPRLRNDIDEPSRQTANVFRRQALMSLVNELVSVIGPMSCNTTERRIIDEFILSIS